MCDARVLRNFCESAAPRSAQKPDNKGLKSCFLYLCPLPFSVTSWRPRGAKSSLLPGLVHLPFFHHTLFPEWASSLSSSLLWGDSGRVAPAWEFNLLERRKKTFSTWETWSCYSLRARWPPHAHSLQNNERLTVGVTHSTSMKYSSIWHLRDLALLCVVLEQGQVEKCPSFTLDSLSAPLLCCPLKKLWMPLNRILKFKQVWTELRLGGTRMEKDAKRT